MAVRKIEKDDDSALDAEIERLHKNDRAGESTVTVGGEEDDEPDDEPEPKAAKPGERTPRQERRAERGKSYRELREQLEAERAERERDREELTQLRGTVQNIDQHLRQPAKEPEPQEDPEKREIDLARREIATMAREWEGMTAEQRVAAQDKYQGRWNELNDTITEANARRAYRKMQPKESSQQRPDVRSEVHLSMLQAKHPDVFANPKAVAYARYLAGQKKLLNQPDTEETMDQVFEETRKAMGMPAKTRTGTPVTKSERSRFGGSPVGGASGGAGARTFVLTKNDKADARRAFPELVQKHGEQAAFKKYATEVLARDD